MSETPDPLEAALAEILDAESAGRSVERAAWLARFPDLATELAEFLDAHARLNAVAAPLRRSLQDSEVTLAFTSDRQRTSGTPSHGEGERFGDYELLDEIGRGGMGVVFKARHTRLQRIVALKMVLAGRFADDADVARFREEASTAAALDHPGIVPIYEAGEIDALPYYSMGFVEGISLAERLKQGPLPPAEAVRLVRGITSAVEYAHAHGVIHRDLKPANILLAKDADGRLDPRITDFGLARRLDMDSRLTTTGQVLGTPSYMPPEQASGRPHAAGAASDVFSLGAILYALLAGRPPFVADSPMEVLLQVLEKDPPSLCGLNAFVPRELEWICVKCLEKAPEDRYASAAALGDDLDRFLRKEPPEARAGTWWQRLRRWGRREPVFTAHLGVLSGMLLLMQAVFALHPERDLMYHLRISGLMLAWLAACGVLHWAGRLRGRTDGLQIAWSALDVSLLTAALALLAGPIGLLFGFYHVLIGAAGLFFRTRLVAATTVFAVLGGGVLYVLRRPEVGPWHYGLFLEVTLVVTGLLVGYQIWRLGILRDYYEERRPRW